ncbi:uncharacterized protein LOC114299092 [Camellia sinensis]|uniref:uncharacterized protein LOC114299092 n=1 Tax=Camellia sinensis TaxID=4442 RepID=UPI001036B291|nr:uncharacterized protein LOC114299092 [Camellia sinensis]
MRKVTALLCLLLSLVIALPWFLPLLEMVCLVVLVPPLRRISFIVTTAVDLATLDTCWKLHGTPSGGRGDRPGTRGGRSGLSRGRGVNARMHLSDTVEPPPSSPVISPAVDVSGLSASDFEIAFRHLLDRRASHSTIGALFSSFANSGNLVSSPYALLSHTSVPCIIDSGSFNYMSGSSNLFSEYNPSSGQEKVRIADGTISSVSGKEPYHGEEDWQW